MVVIGIGKQLDKGEAQGIPNALAAEGTAGQGLAAQPVGPAAEVPNSITGKPASPQLVPPRHSCRFAQG